MAAVMAVRTYVNFVPYKLLVNCVCCTLFSVPVEPDWLKQYDEVAARRDEVEKAKVLQ